MAANTRIADFFVTERKRLVRYVRRLIEDAAERDGEDIVQDVALNLFSRADVTVPIENLSGYIYQALRHRVIDYLRRRKLTMSYEDTIGTQGDPALFEFLSASMFDAETRIGRSELRQRLYEAIESLSDDQKAVVIENEFQGRSFQELSREWGIPVGTLLARKSRAMARMRVALEDLKP